MIDIRKCIYSLFPNITVPGGRLSKGKTHRSREMDKTIAF
jgi:hypothetical protein